MITGKKTVDSNNGPVQNSIYRKKTITKFFPREILYYQEYVQNMKLQKRKVVDACHYSFVYPLYANVPSIKKCVIGNALQLPQGNKKYFKLQASNLQVIHHLFIITFPRFYFFFLFHINLLLFFAVPILSSVFIIN